MKVTLLLLAVIIVAVSAYSEQEYQFTFSSWMRTHGKTYDASEFQARYSAFKNNMDYVRDYNAKQTGTVLGLNIMADLTNAEYRSIYLGTKIQVKDSGVKIVKERKLVGDSFNFTVDWRAKGAVTPIKNQGECGSCWAFSTTGSTEGAYFLKTGNLVSLSEQNLVDCSGAQGNEGCNGGLMDQGFQYIITNKGIDTEASYPYTATDGSCAFLAKNIGATITSFKDIPSKDEGALAAAVNNQPVSVAIDASHPSFQLYASGVYHEWFCSETSLDHGVLAVGYGVDSSFLQKKHFWIVKNSWGTSWGQSGYIYMSKDRDNNCGIATVASYPVA